MLPIFGGQSSFRLCGSSLQYRGCDAEDNRNCAYLIFQRLPGGKGVGDKNIGVQVDEFFRGGAQFIRVTRRPPAIINLNILAFRPTSLLETSSEGRDECWG